MKNSRWLALIILIAGIVIMMFDGFAQPSSPTSALPDGYDSTTVAALQAEIQGDDQGQPAIVVFSSEQPFTPEQFAQLQAKAEEIGAPLIPNEDATGALIPATVNAGGPVENNEMVTAIRETAAADLPEGITSQVTGPAAITADLAAVFDGANFMLLAVTALIVAVLLIVTYRSPILWIIPLFVIAIADRASMVVLTWVLHPLGVVWNESTTGIVSVLVFGAGTNYALLLISRYRDELHNHESRFDAMAAAWKPTLHTVTASAATVVVGVACLLLSVVPGTRGLGLSSMVGIVVAYIFAMFALPGALVTFGRWIFWPRRPEYGDEVKTGFWEKIGGWVKAKPLPIAAGSMVILIIACLGNLGIQTGLTQADQFVKQPESIAAADVLAEKFPDQSATPAVVATQNPDQVIALLGGNARPNAEVNGYTLLDVPTSDVEGLREQLAEADALVGGADAQLVDAELSAARDRAIIFPAVLLLILLALIVVLRSVAAPVIMVATVLLTNVAALGLGWWISSGIFGFNRFAAETPLYTFVFLVALGIDYSIFLVTRAKQEAAAQGVKDGVLTSLAATGGVITSAGILLAAVFAALGVLPLVVLAQVGIVIFVGVLLDTLIVRTVLIPAIVQLMGRKFFWPAQALAD
ncbi:MAG: MMPL family transporter [Corynebacterium sp.]|nr:MMPL family transporter [Corynebacterium sp.]